MSKSNKPYKIKIKSHAASAKQVQPKHGKYEKHTQPKFKKPAMPLSEKLALLSEARGIYFAQLMLLCLCALLMPKDLLSTEPGAWQGYVQQKTGLFGEETSWAIGYALLLLVAAAVAALPLYTRVLYAPVQLLPAMLLQIGIFPILWRAVLVKKYFGNHLDTILTSGGWLLGAACVLCLLLQCCLVRKYRRIPRVE